MAWVAYFVGGVDHLIKAFIILLAIDYALGVMVEFSYFALKGFTKWCDDNRCLIGLYITIALILIPNC